MGIWVLSLIFTLFDSFLANVKLVTHSWIPKIRNYWWVELCMMSCNCVFFFPLFLLYFFPKFHYMESVSGATAQFTQQSIYDGLHSKSLFYPLSLFQVSLQNTHGIRIRGKQINDTWVEFFNQRPTKHKIWEI